MKRILAAIDGSKPSYRALQQAVALAKGLGAQLTVLLVRQFVVGRSDVLDALSDEEVEAILNHAGEIASAAGDPLPQIVVERSRDVAHAIIEVAMRTEADIIVMGASGMGRLKAFVLGSVTDEVLKKSACPVMVVH